MDNQPQVEKVTILPDPFKIAEDMYFAWEKAIGATMLQVVRSQGFADGIDHILNSYLQYLKFQNDLATKYLKDSPFATRRDMSRVAELVVSLETKIDRIEDYLIERIYEAEEEELIEEKEMQAELEGETSRMMDHQARLEEQFHSVKRQLGSLEDELAGIKEALKELKGMIKS